MKIKTILLTMLFFHVAFMNVSAQGIPQLIYYQGYLADASGNPINTNQAMDFSIWSSQTGGNKLWEESHNSVTIDNALFSIILGSQNPISVDVFSDKTRYLEIVIGGETLSPRQQIASVPYAYTTASMSGATNVIPSDGKVGIGTTSPKTMLEVDGRISSTKYGFKFPDGTVQTSAATSGGSSSCGWTDDGTVVRLSTSTDKVGIGTTNPSSLLSVGGSGIANAAITGLTGSTNGYAVYGSAHNSSGTTNYGGYFKATGTNGRGVYGEASNYGDVKNYGGFFSAFGKSGRGVLGSTTGSNGIGVYGDAIGSSGVGVYGNAPGNSGVGVYGVGGDYACYFVGRGYFSGNVGIGKKNPQSRLDVQGNITVRDKSSGIVAIELGTGLDYSEGFNVSDKNNIEPGTVLCIDQGNPGKLKISQQSYDFKVAGIVAGAGDLGSGVTLGSGAHDFNVALAGRVYCKIDATKEAIQAGDLLTTSDTPGYAQKVTNHRKSQGAVLGKAMQDLEKGKKGQILVLVTLQ